MDEATHDEVAGIVDLFGALTREELERALSELAFRQGGDVREAAVGEAIGEALREYYLVAVDGAAVAGVDADGDGPSEVLVPGPVAFPALPEDAEDLPHIMDVPARSVDRAAVAAGVAEGLREDARAAIDAADDHRAAHLFDVTYDVEAWGDVDLADVREDIEDADLV